MARVESALVVARELGADHRRLRHRRNYDQVVRLGRTRVSICASLPCRCGGDCAVSCAADTRLNLPAKRAESQKNHRYVSGFGDALREYKLPSDAAFQLERLAAFSRHSFGLGRANHRGATYADQFQERFSVIDRLPAFQRYDAFDCRLRRHLSDRLVFKDNR